MDVVCPYCSRIVQNARPGTEVECPQCHASFFPEAVNDLEPPASCHTRPRRTTGRREAKTEAYIREEEEPTHPASPRRPTGFEGGAYGFRSSDLRHATEVVAPSGESPDEAGSGAPWPTESTASTREDVVFTRPKTEASFKEVPSERGSISARSREAGRTESREEPAQNRAEKAEASLSDFDIPDDFSLSLDDLAELSKPEPEPKQTRTGQEQSSLETPDHEGLDLKLDDVAQGQPDAQEPGAIGLEVQELDEPGVKAEKGQDSLLEAVLSEDSVPGASVDYWSAQTETPNGSRQQPETDMDLSSVEPGGKRDDDDSRLGLVDEWPDLQEGPSGEEDTEDLGGAPLEVDIPADVSPPTLGPKSTAAPASPASEVRPPEGAAELPGKLPTRVVKKRTSTRALLKGIAFATLLVCLVGVGLGQTDYGYFGWKLLVPDRQAEMARRQRLAMPAELTKDTKDAFIEQIRDLEQAIDKDPDDQNLKRRLWEILLTFKERYPEAFSAEPRLQKKLEKLRRRTKLPGVKLGLFTVVDLMSKGNYRAAKAALDGLVVASARDPRILYLYGKVALGEGKVEEAQRYFELALLKSKGFVAARFFLAKTLMKKGQLGSAREKLDTILKQEPDHLGAKVLLARVALNQKQDALATRLVREVVAKAGTKLHKSELFQAHLVLAELARRRRDHKSLMEELAAALKLFPTDQETAVKLARLLYQDKRYDEALQALEPCYKKGCDSEEFLSTFAEIAYAADVREKAQEALKKGHGKYPNSASFYIIHGRYLLSLGRFRSASVAFQAALKVAPMSQQALLLLAEALTKEGRISEAISRLEAELAKFRDKVPLLTRLADLHLKKHDYAAAEETLRKLLDIEPKNLKAQEKLGIVVMKMGRMKEALAILSELYRKRAISKKGAVNLAAVYMALRRPKEAKDVLSPFYEGATDDPEIQSEYGYSLVEAGALKEGKKVLEGVLRNYPSHARSRYYLGLMYLKKHQVKKAIDQMSKAVQADPRDTTIQLALARILYGRGTEEDQSQALRYLNQIIDAYKKGYVAPEKMDPEAYFLHGKILFKRQKYRRAMRDFEAALALSPSRLDIMVGFARSLFELAKYHQALAYFKQVLKRVPSHAEANYYIALIYKRREKLDLARKHLERVVQSDPKRFYDAYRLLGLIYRDQRLPQLAQRAFSSFLGLAPDKTTAEVEEVKRLLRRQ